MSHSVCNDIAYIDYGNGRGCCCNGGTPPTIYRSVWDRLVQQMFGNIPLGLDSEDVLPSITIWEEGVTLVSDVNGVYSFNVTTSGGSSPKPDDVILYKGKYYVVGEVA